MAGNIFICYRRDAHDRHAAGRLYQSIRERFPREQIFIDIDNIEVGLDFEKVIQEKISTAAAVLVVIGPNWLNAADKSGQRRLDNPHDYVRMEIEAGLRRDTRVIPVLVDDAEMPRADELPEPLKPLALRNAATIQHGSFTTDAERLATALAKIIPSKAGAGDPPSNSGTGNTERAAGGWQVELAKRTSKEFAIKFWQAGREAHHLSFVLTTGIDHLELDGSSIDWYLQGGVKKKQFKVGTYPNIFEVRFNPHGVRRFVGGLRFTIDGELMLSSD
jgi:hypothetical protein